MLSPVPRLTSITAARQRLLHALRRFEKRRLIEHLIVREPLTETEEEHGRELAIKHDWEGQLRRIRGLEPRK